jgi:hypothetical protein
MIFALVLAPAALAACDLPTAIGGGSACQTYTVKAGDGANKLKAFGYFDADELPAGASGTVSLTVKRKTSPHDDHNGEKHAATFGDLKYDGPAGTGRYVLDCEQPTTTKVEGVATGNGKDQWIPAEGAPANTQCKDANSPSSVCALNEKYFNGEFKTLHVEVTRPAVMGTDDVNFFQGEFLNMYKKGSWEVLRTEHEPYMHNNYGSVVPLATFRAGDQDLDVDNSKSTHPTFNVYMAAPNDGDFEFRYGNPNLIFGRDDDLTTDQKKACLKAGPDDSEKHCGTWTSIHFSKSMLRVGTPWKSCGTGSQLADTEHQDIGVILPAYLGHPNLKDDKYAAFTTAALTTNRDTLVVLDIFSPQAGNGDCVTTDGVQTCTPHSRNVDKWTYSGKGDASYTGAAADVTDSKLKIPCQEDDWENANAGSPNQCDLHGGYSKCYEAGTPCPLSHNVCKEEYCNINRWGAIQDALKPVAAGETTYTGHIKTLGFIETYDHVKEEARSKAAIKADVQKYSDFAATTVDGYFFNRVDSNNLALTKALKEIAFEQTDKKIVFSTGQALTDPNMITSSPAVAATASTEAVLATREPDVVVTLNADKEQKKDWNPFAWFPDELPTRWGALLTNVATGEEDLAKLLFDRGYGYIGLHAADGEDAYGQVSARLSDALTAIDTATRSSVGGGRRLQEAETPSTYEWSCDAAQFYCAPVCMRTTGVVTAIVPDSKCEGMKQTCSCSCLYDAHWDCVDGAVVCKATHTTKLEPEIVGDLVCSTRGTKKPETCIRQLTARGTYPEQQCMTQFQEEKEARLAANVAREEAAAAREAARVAALEAMNTKTEPTDNEPELKDTLDVQSSALPAALLALAGLFA